MGYSKPQRSDFDAVLSAENKTIKATQIQEGMISLFKQGYEDFWGVENDTSKHTVEQMQQIIDEMPAALDILTDVVKFKTFANNAFPGMLEEKYHTAALKENVPVSFNDVFKSSHLTFKVLIKELTSNVSFSTPIGSVGVPEDSKISLICKDSTFIKILTISFNIIYIIITVILWIQSFYS